MHIGKKVVELDGNGRFLGHYFTVDNKLYFHGRCRYCGRWYNVEGKEPAHCGKSGCEEFNLRYIKHSLRKVELDNAFKEFVNSPEMVKKLINKSKNIFREIHKAAIV